MYFDYYSARMRLFCISLVAPGMNPEGQYPSMQVMPPAYSPMSPDVNYPRPAANMPAPGLEQPSGMPPAPGMQPVPGMPPAPGMPQTAEMNNKEKAAMGHELPMMYNQQANVPFVPYSVLSKESRLYVGLSQLSWQPRLYVRRLSVRFLR